MLSIKEIEKRLPNEFIEEIYENFSPVTANKILVGLCEKHEVTIRVNTIKYDIQSLMKHLKDVNIKFERVLWYKDALVIKNASEKDLQNLDIYKNGYIYMQSLSSMIPPCVLMPKEGEKVLDLTAAPGSKTTQMAAMMNNKGYILANELDKIRYERLKYNINAQGASIVDVINGRGEKVGDEYEEYFDKVLLDAPCSGEGIFIAENPGTYRSWSIKTVNQLSKIQKKLLLSAEKALKPNGILVYSTCTLNKKENEEVVDWAINNLKLKIQDIDLEIKGAINAFNEGKDKSIEKAMRVLPSKETEGFFVCRFKKI